MPPQTIVFFSQQKICRQPPKIPNAALREVRASATIQEEKCATWGGPGASQSELKTSRQTA